MRRIKHFVWFQTQARRSSFVLSMNAPALQSISMKRVLIFLLALCWATVGRAWDYEGHRIVNELALDALPQDFPAFARTPEARERIAFLSGEPDRWRNSTNFAAKHAQDPDHFWDHDDLSRFGISASQLTPFRYDFVALLAEGHARNRSNFVNLPVDPTHTRLLIGFLPWSINEQFARLESAFSYLREFESAGTREEIANARQNVIHIMGTMGHYVGDAAQPLHSTKHYNGWIGANPNRYATNRSIHAWIDGGFIRASGITRKALQPKMRTARALWNESPTNAFAESMAFILESHKLVEPLYVLNRDGALSPRDAREAEGREFLGNQLIRGSQMLSDLWYSAWLHAPPDTFLRKQLRGRKDSGSK
jgi:hypothetical protein